MEKHDVVIVGAGLSGLTAAICAALDGKTVIVFEKNPEKDGSFPRSVHTVMCDFDKLEKFIGFCVRDCFLSMPKTGVRFSSAIFTVDGKYIFNVERGYCKQSVDSFLRKRAVELGVKIVYNNPIDDVNCCLEYLKVPNMGNIILAIGMFADIEESLNVYDGFYTVIGEYSDEHVYANAFVGDFAYKQYGYVSSANGIATPLIFSRKKVTNCDWNLFKKVLMMAGVCNSPIKKTFEGFARYRKYPRLFDKNGCIFCGAYAGAIDPYMGFGIVYAMISGKIAAIALTDREKARRYFNRMVIRKFYLSLMLQKLYYCTPFSEKMFEIYCRFFNPLSLVKLVSPTIKEEMK